MMSVVTPALSKIGAAKPSVAANKIRILLVDDSAVIRGFLTRILSVETDMEIVATASDGALAVASLKRIPADVIILDIEMPNMDGLTAIPLLLAVCPSAKIVMASTLTLKNASASLKAISAGAADYLAKPTTATNFAGDSSFGLELVQKVRALGYAAKRQSQLSHPATAPPVASKSLALRPLVEKAPRYLAIGSSTGGPQALFTVLKSLVAVKQPILITQHMPASFTTMLAEHITRQCGISCVEAQHGMPLRGGRVHIAPGGYHMTVKADVLSLNQEPQENFCRPSVDVMLRSLSETMHPVLVTILTGMGQDGFKGCQSLLAGGNSNVLAQDEETSVVWGMPGIVANSGLAAAVLPLNAIGPKIRQLAMKI